jgi:hypothetical protein
MAMMLRFIVAGLVGGILFGAMDGAIHGNPLAQKLFAVFRPISRQSVNILAGIIIDLIFGFIMTGIFLLLYKSLPGRSWFLKGVSFALIIWLFRVVMSVASQWMVFKIPFPTLLYSLGTGLLEMLVLGLVYSLLLRR